MRIGFASADWSDLFEATNSAPTLGGSGNARVGLPARFLEEAGHEVFVGTLVWGGHRREQFGVKLWDSDDHVFDCDVLVMQRWMTDDIAQKLKRLAGRQVIVNDVDDWWDGLDPRNNAFHATHPGQNAQMNRNHYRKIVAWSPFLTCSTPFLVRQMRKTSSGEVSLVRNILDLRDWPGVREPRLAPAAPRIGWVGALPWRSGDIETMRGILSQVLERSDMQFHHSGHIDHLPSFAEIAGLDLDRCSTQPMCDITDYASTMFRRIDIGIVPLSPRPFNDAKSCIKGMEYVASGIPFVASASEDYRWLSEEIGIGRVARRPRDWIRHLTELADPDVRHREAVENHQRLVGLSAGLRDQWEAHYTSILAKHMRSSLSA